MILADPPVVKLRLGPQLQSDIIEEGKDVYLECDVKSNPEVYKIEWKQEVGIYLDLFCTL